MKARAPHIAAMALVGIATLAGPGSAEEPDRALSAIAAEVGDVQVLVGTLALELGRPATRPVPVRLSGAGAGDVHALAENFLVRADQLLYDRTRTIAKAVTVGGAADAHGAYLLLGAGAARLRLVLEHLDIAPDSSLAVEVPADWDRVAGTLLEIGGALDRTLGRSIETGETYERLTRAIGHAARLVTVATGEAGLSTPPPHERRQRPGDVCARLVTCLGLLQKIEPAKIVAAELTPRARESAHEGLAFDLAAVVAANVASLRARTRGAADGLPAYYPGPVTPSDAHQRAGQLEIQLATVFGHRDVLLSRLRKPGEVALR